MAELAAPRSAKGANLKCRMVMLSKATASHLYRCNNKLRASVIPKFVGPGLVSVVLGSDSSLLQGYCRLELRLSSSSAESLHQSLSTTMLHPKSFGET